MVKNAILSEDIVNNIILSMCKEYYCLVTIYQRVLYYLKISKIMLYYLKIF